MEDGNFISSNQKLLYICTEENLIRFETIDDSDIKRIFWAKVEEVDFIEEKEENWPLEQIEHRKKEINENWL